MQTLKVRYNSFLYLLTHTFYYNFIYFIPFPLRRAIISPSQNFLYTTRITLIHHPPPSLSLHLSLYHSTRL